MIFSGGDCITTSWSAKSPQLLEKLSSDGYTSFQQLFVTQHSTVLRAVDKRNDKSVIIKYHSDEFPSQRVYQKFVKEFEIGSLFDHECIVKYHRIYHSAYQIAIVLEDFNAISLRNWLRSGGVNSIADFFIIALKLVNGLSIIHNKGIIHGSITPSNILLNPETMTLKVSDFGCSSQLNKEIPSLVHFETFQISLEYISPEQTGRMNRDIDYRSDFYQLGIVLYELLCGHTPFESEDPLDVVYSHMAVKPIDLQSRNPTKVPQMVSRIVMRLLEKSADARYQSSFGIESDLKKCFDLWSGLGHIPEFILGEQDRSTTFHLKQRLYGRELEIKQLLSAFDQITTGMLSNMFIAVKGSAGIGKSSLVNELHRPLTKHKGYFISGKFDQFNRNIPYSAFILAFQQLVVQLLTESEARKEYWKQSILESIGSNAQIIVDVLPQIELLIGKQSPAPTVGATESENRFKILIQSFTRVFADASHPLIIFLDDLQWADSASLSIIQLLLTNSDNKYLLIIGAYRDNELCEHHPLNSILSSIDQVESISLDPLGIDSVEALITDSFCCTRDQAIALSNFIYTNTHGNSFFIIQTLNSLVDDQLVRFNFEEGKWQWDLVEISQNPAYTNVQQMITDRISKLPQQCQDLLSIAAAIGNSFDLDILSKTNETDHQTTYSILWSAIRDGLIIQLGSEFKWLSSLESISNPKLVSFKFMHDKLQQACWELVTPQNQTILHLTLGRLMHSMQKEESIEQSPFDIIGHFRAAKELLTLPEENLEISELCIRAAKRAKDSAAYEQSVGYLTFATELLPKNHWDVHYKVSLDLYKTLAECEYLRRNYSIAETLYSVLLSNVKTDLEKIAIYCIQVNQYETQDNLVLATEIMQHCLKLLGIHFPDTEEEIELLAEQELASITQQLVNCDIEDLKYCEEITDERIISIMSILMNIWTLFYTSGKQAQVRYVTALFTNLSLLHGKCEYTSAAYVFYSFLVSTSNRDYQTSSEFDKVALYLAYKYDNLKARCKTLLLLSVTTHYYTEPLTACTQLQENCFKLCLEVGDFATSAHLAHYNVTDRFFQGLELEKVFQQYEYYIPYLKRSHAMMHTFGMCTTSAFRYLMEIEDDYNEDDVIKTHTNSVLVSAYYFGKVLKAFWANDQTDIIHLASKAYSLSKQYLVGTYKIIELSFYVALIYIRNLNKMNEKDRSFYLAESKRLLEDLRCWAAACEANVRHKQYIVEAELAHFEKDVMKATELFEMAINSAAKYRFMQFEALANELCAEMLIKKGKERYARSHIKDAAYIYSKYGAKAKIKQLKENYPGILLGLLEESVPKSQVDMMTLVRATKALSSEMNLDELVNEMMKLLITHSGAHRGIYFLVQPDNQLLVLAEGNIQRTQVDTLCAESFVTWSGDCPRSLINYTCNTKQMLIYDSVQDNPFSTDMYFETSDTQSLMSIPVLKNNEFKGILYLESTLKCAFSTKQVEFMRILTSQLALMLENAKFSALLASEKKYRSIASELEIIKKRLEEFIDVLCHELRNPLNAICGNTAVISDIIESTQQRIEILKHHSNDSKTIEDLCEAVDSIKSSSHHLKDIVDTVLNLSALENNGEHNVLQSVVFKPKEVINLIMAMFKPQFKEKSIAGTVNHENFNDVSVIGDAYRFKEILINLISNALKFTHEGSILVISKYREKPNNKILLEIKVTDTGIGISDEERKKLFKPFSQASRTTYSKYGGSGLGLKICKDLVELMGGSIRVESQVDTGSTFIFTVLLEKHVVVEPLKPTSTPDTAQSVPQEKQAFKILVAEDNPINAKLLVRILQMAGHQTRLVDNGAQAIEAIAKETFDLAMFDIEMPILSGMDATIAIRKKEMENKVPRVMPIIGVSANARKDFLEKALAAGLQDYITKPYLKEDVINAVQKWGDKSRREVHSNN